MSIPGVSEPNAAEAKPFGAEIWQLHTGAGTELTLEPIRHERAGPLAAAITAIDPWARMGFSAAAMAAYLTSREPGTCRRAICRDGLAIGAVGIRHPWLRGPYLELLAVLPGRQSSGIGAAILDWMEREVTGAYPNHPGNPRANSLWVCTSDFNHRAQAFYARHGFARVGEIDGLVGPDFTEILLRKRLAP